ncbi:MAG: asparaginase [Lachnospiraceae bacterium]|nr:asparaginase [Lachnospiraceae bacterium]
MKKILAIATGGTIASESSETGLTPQISLEDFLHYVPQIEQICDLYAVQIMNLDSTNLQPSDWLNIAEKICSEYENYDGFVVLHGTDTMSFTAAALSYLIQNSPKPIVLTGAQKPIDQDITDARSNVIQSILYACDDHASEVSIVFNGEVIAGTRSRKQRTKSFNAFTSVDFPHKAVIRDNRIIHYIEPEITESMRCFHELNQRVFVLKLIPGLKADILDYLKNQYDAVVIEGFGVGGIPNTEELHFQEKISELLDAGKLVVVTTQVPLEGSDMNIYEVGKQFRQDKRIVEAYNMTLEAIVTKLMWLLARTEVLEERQKLFYQPVNFDLYI